MNIYRRIGRSSMERIFQGPLDCRQEHLREQGLLAPVIEVYSYRGIVLSRVVDDGRQIEKVYIQTPEGTRAVASLLAAEETIDEAEDLDQWQNHQQQLNQTGGWALR